VDALLASRILPAQAPNPERTKLVSSIYNPSDIQSFTYISAETENVAPMYFPFLRSTTPSRLTESQIGSLETNTKFLKSFLELDPPIPVNKYILKAKWFVPLVDTDFGSALRTRFEQLFYGLTVSSKTPCITYFTSNNEISRHKFYTANKNTKVPELDLTLWNQWWSRYKPNRNKPTLILFRGTSVDVCDKIALTSTDIQFTVYRDMKHSKSLETLRDDMIEWFKSLDSVYPFVSSSDIASCRLELQDLSFSLKYSSNLESIDMRRFPCITGIFNTIATEPSKFRFLRTDYSDEGLTIQEIQVLQMIKTNFIVTAQQVQDQLKISDAQSILTKLHSLLNEDPDFGASVRRGVPIIEIGKDTVRMSHIKVLDKSVQYANLLRYILSNPKSDVKLNTVCPSRIETVSSKQAEVRTEQLGDSFNEFDFGDLEVAEEESVTDSQEPASVQTSKKNTLHKYYTTRLQKFDKEAYDPTDTQYPKKCEQSHQPIIMTTTEIEKAGEEYNPSKLPENETIPLDNGTIVCPEYWCMTDNIPLKKTQLKSENGVLMCPVCNGKVRDSKKTSLDVGEYSVISRGTEFKHPGYVKDYLSPKEKPVACCFKTENNRELKIKEKENKYYILGETKSELGAFRLSYLSEKLLKSIHIVENYEKMMKNNTISTKSSGFFRVGLGDVISTLPTLMNMKDKVVPEPSNSVKTLLQCSFLSSWTNIVDGNTETIETKLKEFEPFSTCEVSRKEMAKIVYSVNEAFSNKKLSPIQMLEYIALTFQIDIFRIDIETNTVGCTFFTRMFRSRTRAMIVLQKGSDLDILSHVSRKQNTLNYTSNIYQEPFKRDSQSILEKLRTMSCMSKVPVLHDAANAIIHILPELKDDISVIMDPIGRGQALFIPNQAIIPFQSTPVPSVIFPKISGYSQIKDKLPPYQKMVEYLEKLKTEHSGYEFSEAIHDSDGNRVEILTKSGLRIPVIPEKEPGEPSDVITSTFTEGETQLVFGKPNPEDMRTYREITYSSELFEFLLFQLSKDIKSEDYAELREKLKQPNRQSLEPSLKRWYETTTHFVDIPDPIEFISKVRTPCGQYKSKETCNTGRMCAWNAGKCQIEVRSSVANSKLFTRLLNVLVENSKQRAVVLDGRSTPFFSTVLYMELPNEVILTDETVKKGSM